MGINIRIDEETHKMLDKERQPGERSFNAIIKRILEAHKSRNETQKISSYLNPTRE